MCIISPSEKKQIEELIAKLPKPTPEEIKYLTDVYINVDIGYPANPEEIAKALEKVMKEYVERQNAYPPT